MGPKANTFASAHHWRNSRCLSIDHLSKHVSERELKKNSDILIANLAVTDPLVGAVSMLLSVAVDALILRGTVSPAQDEILRIRKRKRGRNMLNRSGNTTDNLCFRYRFRDVFSRFRCCVYNGTGPLFVHVKHNGNMELNVSTPFQKYGNM